MASSATTHAMATRSADAQGLMTEVAAPDARSRTWSIRSGSSVGSAPDLSILPGYREMSKQEIRIDMQADAPENGPIRLDVSGIPPVTVKRSSKSTCRPVDPALNMFRVRTLVDVEASDYLLTAQELFVDALRSDWTRFFAEASIDVLDDASEPVVSINKAGDRVVTLLTEGEWPNDVEEVSLRLTGAVFDGVGLAVVWTLVLPEKPQPEEPEPPAEDTQPEVAVTEEDKKRMRRERKKRIAREAAAAAAALAALSDSE